MLSLKNISKLKHKKYRLQLKSFLIEGTKGVEEALDSELELVGMLYTKEWQRQHPHLWQHKNAKIIPQREIDPTELKSLTDSVTPQGVVVIAKIPSVRFDRLANSKLVVVLEDIRDPGNLGTMIRTADWFGVDALLLMGGADPYQPKVVRSAMGSISHMLLYQSTDIKGEIKQLHDHGFVITTTRPELLDQKALNVPKQDKHAIIFGNESRGTSFMLDELADQSISIPKFGNAESLNVAISFGIVLYEVTKKN